MDIEQAKAIFAEREVTTALVVDDVFDAFEEFEADDLGRAYQLIEDTDDVLPAFQGVGGVAPADADALGGQITASKELRDALFAAREGAAGPLRDLGNAVFGRVANDRLGRLKPIEDLIAVLKTLGVETTTVGSDGPGGADAPHYPVIFMDYYLGSKGTPSVERSRLRIQEIVSHYGPNDAPLVILMSSELNNKKKEAGKFRADAQLLGSQFKFAKKAEFEDDNMEFVSSLASMVRFLPQTRTIGAFVKSWSGALRDAVVEFEKGIYELDLQDYFQIRTKLGKDGEHHFGEHVSGLFDGYLRKLVEDRPSLRSSTAAMNALSFAGRPPTPFAPSATVVKMADAAAFQSFPDAVPEVPGRLSIELGDVYLRETGTRKKVKSALVVISQACDLEHGKTDTVLLLNGIVSKRSGEKVERAVGGRPIIRTDLFLHEGDNLIIDWDASDLQAVKVAEFPGWMKQMTYEKVARLRPMQALALQQRFASHLTRVGLPEAPPPYRYPNVEVMITRGNKKERLMELVQPGDLACVIGDDKPEAVLHDALLHRISKSLDEADGNGLDKTEWDQAKDLLSDWQKREAFQTLELKDGKATVGNIVVMDGGKALAAGDGLPKGSWMAINLFG